MINELLRQKKKEKKNSPYEQINLQLRIIV